MFQKITQIVKNKLFSLLMIPNKEKREAKSEVPRWNYLAVKNLPASLTGITSKHCGDFYCLIYLHSFRTKNKLESHKTV